MCKCWLPVRNIASFVDQLIRCCLMLWGFTLIDWVPCSFAQRCYGWRCLQGLTVLEVQWIQVVSFGYWQSPSLGYIHIRKSSENAKENSQVKWLLLTIFNIVYTLATQRNTQGWPEMIDTTVTIIGFQSIVRSYKVTYDLHEVTFSRPSFWRFKFDQVCIHPTVSKKTMTGNAFLVDFWWFLILLHLGTNTAKKGGTHPVKLRPC